MGLHIERPDTGRFHVEYHAVAGTVPGVAWLRA